MSIQGKHLHTISQSNNAESVVTGDEPGGQPVVQLLFVVSDRLLCQDLEVQDEHDHHAILVLHRHHVHHAQEAVSCRSREKMKIGQKDLI